MVLQEQQKRENAEKAAEVLFAVNFLQQTFVQIIRDKVPSYNKKVVHLDFNQCLGVLLTHKETIFTGSSQSKTSIRKLLDRARNVRNTYSHQSFNAARHQHNVECLEKVAVLVGLDPKSLKLTIATPTLPTPCGPSKLPNEWESLKEEGNQFYKSSNWTEAMNCYTQALSRDPKQAVLYSNRALCEIQLEMFDLAREDAEDAIELDKKQVKYYRTLSEALYHLKLFPEAVEVAERGLEIDPRDPTLLLRSRTCKALVVDEEVKRHPTGGALRPEDKGRVLDLKQELEFMRLKVLVDEHEIAEDEICTKQFKIFKENLDTCQKAHQLVFATAGAGSQIEREKKALKLFEQAAAKGCPEGLFNVALMYSEGQAGLARDFKRSLDLFHQVVREHKPYVKIMPIGFVEHHLGVAEAENMISLRFRDGLGVEANQEEAFKWFLRSARHGCESAMNNLGVAFKKGAGCTKNLENARYWYSEAARRGQSEAKLNLGIMLVDGEGGPRDLQKAVELIKEAADQGLQKALEPLQHLMRSGRMGPSLMTDAAAKMLIAKANHQDKEALYLLGKNHVEGIGGFPKDLAKAEEYLKDADKHGHPGAAELLTDLLVKLKRHGEAHQYLARSATAGNRRAQELLGRHLARGVGCPRDIAQARKWLVRSGKYEAGSKELEDAIGLSSQIVEFEQKEKLGTDGLGLHERWLRYLRNVCLSNKKDASPEVANHLETLFTALQVSGETISPAKDLSKMMTKFPEMVERARSGSKAAEDFLKAHDMQEAACQALLQNDYSEAFRLFRTARKVWDLLPIDEHARKRFYEAAMAVLEKNPNDPEAMFFVVHYNFQRDRYNLKELVMLAEQGISLNPDFADFHEFAGHLHGFNGNYDAALRYFDRALELERVPDWLYGRATALRLLETPVNQEEVIIRAYLDYLEENHPDARKVPEALYWIAYTYLEMGNAEKAREYHELAVQAEDPAVRLPCFDPVADTFPPKAYLKTFVLLPAEKKNAVASAFLKCSTEMLCENCGKAEPVMKRCGRCERAKYCSRECQRESWPIHRKDCKN